MLKMLYIFCEILPYVQHIITYDTSNAILHLTCYAKSANDAGRSGLWLVAGSRTNIWRDDVAWCTYKSIGGFLLFSTALAERCYAPALYPGIILGHTNTARKTLYLSHFYLQSPTPSLCLPSYFSAPSTESVAPVKCKTSRSTSTTCQQREYKSH